MVFSSTIFLFLFLPCVLAAYFLTPRKLGNLVLLLASLLFYAWGETFYVGIMLLSIASNFVFGRWISKHGKTSKGRWALGSAIAVNLGILWVFKYANFVVDNVNTLLGWFGSAPILLEPVHLPIGISFFALQAISFLMDVYRGDARPPRNVIDLALYISLFPQLIAGPIVRYQEISESLRERRTRATDFAEGVRRFILGLGKKVLIANALDVSTADIFALPATELTPSVAWFGLVAHTMQVYFDFSGYSDMAIGLGRMFGFRFSENFRFPFISTSIREVWTRWHISLGSWFRDYLYLPMGGNRAGSLRLYRNLLTVFVLCGLWHGANWTFIVFGCYHGFFLILERQRAFAGFTRAPRVVKHLYCLFFWTLGIVLFRAPDIEVAWRFYTALFGFGPWQEAWHTVPMYLTPETVIVFFLAVVCSMPLHKRIGRAWAAWVHGTSGATASVARGISSVATVAGLTAILWMCAAYLSGPTNNPFIYFQF